MSHSDATNPYGGGPGTGITLPPYYRPTPSVKSASNYYPTAENLGSDEMRISFVGSTPFPPRRNQAGTCIMVELGSGDRFFFDFGSGCLRNIIAMQVPVQMVNDLFLSHLHVDHYADIPYLYGFAPWLGRWKPLRVHGPSGRTAKDGTRAMIESMKQMCHWHVDSFESFPVGDGYEVEVNEFDFRDDNGICYEKDGVTIRHWRRSHTKDGASAYRLDWNGLSFVWTGDGRPDELTTKFAKGVDVFVTEMQLDVSKLNAAKFGTPPVMMDVTIDTAHTVHYAAGYLFEQIRPRLAMVTHLEWDDEMQGETVAGIRTHWDGLFQFGAPDVVVVNVTRDAIWTRKAALAETAMPARPSVQEAAKLFGLNREIVFPETRHTLADVQEKAVRDLEIDPAKYYPPDVARPLQRVFPPHFRIDVVDMVVGKLRERAKGARARMVQEVAQRLENGQKHRARDEAREIVRHLPGGVGRMLKKIGQKLEARGERPEPPPPGRP